MINSDLPKLESMCSGSKRKRKEVEVKVEYGNRMLRFEAITLDAR